MDQSRIDALTRFVARRTGRRSLAAGALGGLLATLLPSLRTSGAAAKRKPKPACKKPKRRCGRQCVNVKTSRQHCGKCNHKCKSGHACRQGKCLPPPPCGKGGNCRVFVTSTSHSGGFGGLDGADFICSHRARAAGLPGSYKAWVSTEFASPSTRFTQNPGPYVLTNGTRIANSWGDLTDGTLLAPINVTEKGDVEGSSESVWTGTSPLGTLFGETCWGWTSSAEFDLGNYGKSGDTNGWSHLSTSYCVNNFRLYCFQQS